MKRQSCPVMNKLIIFIRPEKPMVKAGIVKVAVAVLVLIGCMTSKKSALKIRPDLGLSHVHGVDPKHIVFSQLELFQTAIWHSIQQLGGRVYLSKYFRDWFMTPFKPGAPVLCARGVHWKLFQFDVFISNKRLRSCGLVGEGS